MLSINLEKGDKIDLTKHTPTLKKVMVAAGWDMNKEDMSMDADLMAIMLTDSQSVRSKKDFIYYGNKGSQGDCIYCGEDNLTGEGDGDDEFVNVDLTKIPENISKISFLLNIYNAKTKGQNLSDLKNAFIRAVDIETGKELCKLEVKDLNGTTIIFAHLVRISDSWEFQADGITTSDFEGKLSGYGLAA